VIVCYSLANQYPDHLDMGVPPTSLHRDKDNLDVAMVKAAVMGATLGFNSFLLKPDGLRGEDLFDHMIRKRLFDSKVKEHRPIHYLYVECDSNQVA
jgi:hypothetical protein